MCVRERNGLRMPGRYTEMSEKEMEYDGGNGEYRKNKKKVKTTPEYERMATTYTLSYIGLSFGIMSPTIWAIPATAIGVYALGNSVGWW